MRRLLNEPLLHFLVLGCALFVVFGAFKGPSTGQDRITVMAGQIEHLATGFSRSWHRPPTADELNGLIGDYVREEVFYREAKRWGWTKTIRSGRRLQQKLEFFSEDIAAHVEPTDDDLRELLHSESERFRVARAFTFSHVYLNPDRHQNLADIAAQLLVQLHGGGASADISALGDRFLLGNEFDRIPAGEVEKLFGERFVRRLSELSTGEWQGPITSGYGVHLVYLEERSEGRIPSLDEARNHLRRELEGDAAQRGQQGFYQEAFEPL